MELIQLKCPVCSANLSFPEDNKIRSCPYCGVPVFFDDGSKSIHIRVTDDAAMHKTASKERMELDKREREERRQEKRHEFRRVAILVYASFSLAVGLAVLIFMFAGQKVVAAYLGLVLMIVLLTPVLLYLSLMILKHDSTSTNIVETRRWFGLSGDRVETRTTPGGRVLSMWGVYVMVLMSAGLFISSYSERLKKQELVDGGYVLAPFSSSHTVDEDYKNIVLSFEKAGFTNINAEGKKDLVLDLKSIEGTVIEVSIDGKTRFSKGEVFPPDAVVRIVFHSF